MEHAMVTNVITTKTSLILGLRIKSLKYEVENAWKDVCSQRIY